MSTSSADAVTHLHDSASPPSPEVILDGLQGAIAPVRTDATYRLGILTVTFVMILLPLIYIALIALVAYLVYWHAVTNVGMLEHGRGRGKLMVLLAYATPMVVGGIMTLFMMKPLFARPAKAKAKRSLARNDEPLLFAFVERICKAVRAPMPKRIDIDCQVNASASFRHGLWSMLRGNDLVLTIGMPLVVGMSLRQFAGVLAHEFGHFSQGAGMRLSYIIRVISFWFTRVVYERDAWDEWLEKTARQLDFRFGIVLHLARFFVWLSRRVLWVLMVVGHMVAGYLMRQMEFDADRHEARLAGSDVFATTVRRLYELNIANSGAQQDLGQFYEDGRLGDDLPRLVLINTTQLRPEAQEKITELIAESKTGRFDTHPADKDRIESARRENAPGIFRVEGPAASLFRNLDACNQAVTLQYYEEIFGEEFRRDAVNPLDELLTRQNLETESAKSLARYFQETFNVIRPLPVPDGAIDPGEVPAEQLIAEVREARERMNEAIPCFRSAFEQFDETDTHLLQAHCAASVFAAREKPNAQQFSFAVGNANAVQEASQAARLKAEHTEPELARFEKAAKDRLTAALRLLYSSQVAAQLEDAAALQADSQRFLALLQQMNQLISKNVALRNARTSLGILFSYVKQDSNSAALVNQITSEAKTLHQLLTEIKRELQSIEYPFDHAQGAMSIGDYVIRNIPADDEMGSLYEAAGTALERMGTLTTRSLGRVARIAERVEAAVGITAA